MKKILIISDGKAGHESISKGVVENLKDYIKIETLFLYPKMRINAFKLILKYILNSKLSNNLINKNFIKFFYKFDEINLENIDLIISTGGKTSFINIMFSKLYNINNIYCSSLRGLKKELFTFIITINPNDTFPNALIFDIAPIKLNLDKEKALQFAKSIGLQKDKKVYSLLIGGATKEYPFLDDEIIYIIKKMILKAKSDKATLLITTSRRTSKKVEEFLENIKDTQEIAYMVIFNKSPQKVVGSYLQLSDIVFITEDSGSMITEAILAKKPTITVKSTKTSPQKIYKLFIENCKQKNYIISIESEKIVDLNTEYIKFQPFDDKKNRENFIKIIKIMKKGKS